MKKTIKLTVILTIFCLSVFGQGIDFSERTWEENLQEATNQNKLIMLDAYASWCGPCKSMAKYTFADKEVGEYYNKNFICVKMDMEDGIGPQLSRKYELTAYPTIYYINGEGEKIHKSVGYLGTAEFIKEGKKAQKLFKPNEVNTNKDEYVRLKNIHYDSYLNIETGKLESSVIKDEWHSAMWTIEPVSGTSYYRFKNRWKGTYLNVEYGALVCSEIETGWHSAMWTIEEAQDVSDGAYVIKNRWKGTCLYIENGNLKCEHLNGFDTNSMWKQESIRIEVTNKKKR